MKYIFKFSIVVILILVYLLLSNTVFTTLLTNEVALTQFNDSSASYINLQALKSFMNYGWIGIVLISILIFYSDIKKLIKKGE